MTGYTTFHCIVLGSGRYTTKAESYEIKPALLNLVMKEQFSGASTDDAARVV